MSAWLWPPSPQPPPDPVGEVHVWSIATGTMRRPAEEYLALLDDMERERAERFRVADAWRAYVVSHAATREILARYLGVRPRALRFERGERGKPYLHPAHAPRALEFNLSHSVDSALLAVTRIGPVGVDVEEVRELPDMDDIAERFFAPGEREALRRVELDGRAPTWFRCWTRKEAYIKATGDGLHCPLDCFEVSLPPDDPPRLRTLTGGAPDAWTLVDLVPRDGVVGALAIEATCTAVRLWHWEDTSR